VGTWGGWQVFFYFWNKISAVLCIFALQSSALLYCHKHKNRPFLKCLFGYLHFIGKGGFLFLLENEK